MALMSHFLYFIQKETAIVSAWFSKVRTENLANNDGCAKRSQRGQHDCKLENPQINYMQMSPRN